MEYIDSSFVISKVLQEYPETEKVFTKYGMHCRSCMGASEGTIKDGALMHGVCLAAFLSELNKIIKENKEVHGNS